MVTNKELTYFEKVSSIRTTLLFIVLVFSFWSLMVGCSLMDADNTVAPPYQPISITIPPSVFTSYPIILPENVGNLTPLLKWIGGVDSATWSPDSQDIALSLNENNSEKGLYIINVYDSQHKRLILNANGTVAFSPDGKIVSSDSGVLRLWNVATGELTQSYEGNAERFETFPSENSLLLVETFSFYYTTVRLWNLESREPTSIFSFDGFTRDISFNGKKHLLATSIKTEDGNSQIKIWDVEKKEQRCSISQGIYIDFSEQNNILAVSNGQDNISLWDMGNCQRVKIFNVDIGLNSFAINPDGSLLVVGTETGNLNIISTMTGETVKILKDLPAYTNAIAFSPDGRFLMTSSYDDNLDNQVLIIWQVTEQSLEPIIISPEMFNTKTPLVPTQTKP